MAEARYSKTRPCLETLPVRHFPGCSPVLMSRLNCPFRGIRFLPAAWLGVVVSSSLADPCQAKIPECSAALIPESPAALIRDSLVAFDLEASAPVSAWTLDWCRELQLLHSVSAEPATADQSD